MVNCVYEEMHTVNNNIKISCIVNASRFTVFSDAFDFTTIVQSGNLIYCSLSVGFCC